MTTISSNSIIFTVYYVNSLVRCIPHYNCIQHLHLSIVTYFICCTRRKVGCCSGEKEDTQHNIRLVCSLHTRVCMLIRGGGDLCFCTLFTYHVYYLLLLFQPLFVFVVRMCTMFMFSVSSSNETGKECSTDVQALFSISFTITYNHFQCFRFSVRFSHSLRTLSRPYHTVSVPMSVIVLNETFCFTFFFCCFVWKFKLKRNKDGTE